MKDHQALFPLSISFMVLATRFDGETSTTMGANLTSPTANLQFGFWPCHLKLSLMTHIEGIFVAVGLKIRLKAYITPGFMTLMNIYRRVYQLFITSALRVWKYLCWSGWLVSHLTPIHQASIYPAAFGANLAWQSFSAPYFLHPSLCFQHVVFLCT